MKYKPQPVGIDRFDELILGGYYYVDKTWFIKELLDLKGKVNLFTRPRRFGKTLNISMLQYYFENTGENEWNERNRSLFQGMKIMEAGDTYLAKMNAFPVINLSLKSGKQPSYELAFGCLREEIAREYKRHISILDSGKLELERDKYMRIAKEEGSEQEYATSIRFLSECLTKCYDAKTVILIDEYDVPLENSWFAGFYDQMISFIRSVFESALKTNPCLEFAVMTGCLRVSKESIFTGLNNLEIHSILSDAYGEHFGFLQEEADQLLQDYHRTEKQMELKEWYDGYLFGNAEVYNPWSVINYVKALSINPAAFPSPYWKNTSSNAIVKDLVERADFQVKSEIENLIAGGIIEKPVHEDITYGDIYDSEDNLWNFLFFTGYLKQTSVRMEEDIQYVRLAIPNREVRYIYNSTVMNWFRDLIKTRDMTALYQALLSGETESFQKELSELLINSISYMDGGEAFYHGFFLGILENLKEYLVTSNREAGLGRYDIAIRSLNVSKSPIILELNVSDTYKGMETACDAALKQIEVNHYNDWLPEEGYTEVLNYGIAFFKKQCRVKSVRKTLV